MKRKRGRAGHRASLWCRSGEGRGEGGRTPGRASMSSPLPSRSSCWKSERPSEVNTAVACVHHTPPLSDPVVQAGHLQQFLALLEEAGKVACSVVCDVSICVCVMELAYCVDFAQSTEGEGQVGVAMVAVAAAIVADCLAEELSNGCSERSSTSTAE